MDRFSLGNKPVVVVNALVFEAFLKPKSLFLEKVLFPGADIARGDEFGIGLRLDELSICLLYTSPSPRDA